MMIDRDEPDADGFLARWSRRKAAARREAQGAEPSPPPISTADVQIELPELPPPEPLPPELRPPEPTLQLPDIATLDAASDYKPFMQAGVPTELQNEALRKLWRANPILGEMDGLDDCCGDYTDAAVCIGPIKTIYQVGRGMVDALEELIEKLPEAPADEKSEPMVAQEETGSIGLPEPAVPTTFPEAAMAASAPLATDTNRS